MNLKNIQILTISLLLLSFSAVGQKGQIKGVISDKKTGETLAGANVSIQGSTKGASADLDGNYIITDVAPGTYNLVVSFISYKTQVIPGVKIAAGETKVLNAHMEEAVTTLSGVVVTATRKTDTEMSMISTIKSSSLTMSGISSQQFSKSQDKDASEVIKRVPGITITDGRFIIVRGLNERYNTTWLNGASTPSFESDKKAFSFDVIPSGMIDNILIYKTPAPELPSDFAGASVNIYTKNIPDEKSFFISYGTAYRQQTTFNSCHAYQGGKLDWLGFDDGTRTLPSGFPSSKGFSSLLNSSSSADKEKALEYSNQLNNDWSTSPKTIMPDQNFSIGTARRFTIGKISVGNITSLNYGFSSDFKKIFRAAYQTYDEKNDQSVYDFVYNDEQLTQKTKLGLIHNWSFIYKNNQKLEFRNLINQNSTIKTTLREGLENYSGNTIKAYEFYYLTRTTYSGQLGGENTFRNDLSKINYTIGYSYANRKEPDIRRITTILNDEDPTNLHYGEYHVSFGFAANPNLAGRTYIDLNENILIANANYEHKFKDRSSSPVLKAGFYIENKNRDFSARKLGYVINPLSYDDSLSYLPFDQLFDESNFNYTTGIHLDETTNKSDSYESSTQLNAGYLAIKLPISAVSEIYTGVRIEHNIQALDGYNSKNTSQKINVKNDEIKLFPSLNATYNTGEKSLLRLAYGSTINRPEFREIAPFSYYDFELKALITGNPELKNATIQNIDLRYEIYPSPAENISIAGFYKHFDNPIESVLIPTGSGLEYSFDNAPSAYSTGIELDVRKRFLSLKKKTSWIKELSNITLILNASLIKSEVDLGEDAYAYSTNRPMQGQSPYIVNTGIYYQNDSLDLSINLLYNIIGKRIVFVGDPENPDVYELPRNQLDLTISKKIGKYWQLKAGIKDILNQEVIFQQTINVNDKEVDQVTYRYRPGRLISAGITYKF